MKKTVITVLSGVLLSLLLFQCKKQTTGVQTHESAALGNDNPKTAIQINDVPNTREAIRVTEKVFMYLVNDIIKNETIVNEANLSAAAYRNDEPNFRDYYVSLAELSAICESNNYDFNSKLDSLRLELLTAAENVIFEDFYLSGQLVSEGFEIGINQSYRNFRSVVNNTELYTAIEQLNNSKLGLLDPTFQRTNIEFDNTDLIPSWIIIVKPQFGHPNYNHINYILSESGGKKCRFGGVSMVCGDYSDGKKCKCDAVTQ